ncbi:hypothetical protein J1C56_32490 [Aminobacter anthyllidis]|uniref:Uncharacterized protein n=1 Tax=Aminobacter anthyllidis TaxID=1035067 RepID=A0A9X1AIW6_9HYPH|nr:hypothetical protein [Aminobacter anthyllidis]MBT1160243.1 hypothetical protein [Aminobacter anthyllidis]
MEIALLNLSDSEMRELVRKRKRNNAILMVTLLLFVAGMFAASFLHLQNESRASNSSTPITNQ